MKTFWFVRFHTKLKIGKFIRVYDGTIYSVLFGAEKCDSIYRNIRCLIRVKYGVTYAFSHNYARIKVNSYDSSTLEKILTFQKVIILIKPVFTKDKNNYYHKTFLEKCSYK